MPANTHTSVIYGIHAVTAALSQTPVMISRVCFQLGRDDKRMLPLIEKARQLAIAVGYQSRNELTQLAEGASHQGVVAWVKQQAQLGERDIEPYLQRLDKPPFILVLDGIQDPHNLGACLRTADAAGVDLVLAPKDRAVGLTATVHKVASGAAITQRFIQVTNLVRTLQQLKAKGVWCFGAAAEGSQPLYDTDLSGAVALVLGSEGQGLRRLTRYTCDQLISIPMLGGVSSLNVSVATGVCLYEVVRQRATVSNEGVKY